MIINSKDWWENEFQNEWENGIDGKIQTKLFADVSYGLLAPQLKEEFSKLENKVIDWGCALGQGCEYFLEKLMSGKNEKHFSPDKNKKNIIGVDFAEKATNKAKTLYPHYRFENDIESIQEKVDLIYTSNTLEHFYDPFSEFDKLYNKTEKYIVILVPFNQDPTQWHHFKFTEDFFISLQNKYKCKIRQFTIINPIDELYSPTQQVFCVIEK